MAERRMISRGTIASGDRIALRKAYGYEAVVFLYHAILNLDRVGCIDDDPEVLRLRTLPDDPGVSAEDVRAWISWLVRRKMARRVKGEGGRKGLHFPSFMHHQRGAHLEREAASPWDVAILGPRAAAEWRGVQAKRGKAGGAGDSGADPDQVRTGSGSSPAKGSERIGKEVKRAGPRAQARPRAREAQGEDNGPVDAAELVQAEKERLSRAAAEQGYTAPPARARSDQGGEDVV